MAALYGGGLVAWFYGGMSPAIFIARLHEAVSVTHFEVGMIKAPFMALVIGIVASSEGLRVKGSAESLGSRRRSRSSNRSFSSSCSTALSPSSLHRSECDDEGSPAQFAIRVSDLVVGFRQQTVIDHLSLDVRRGEILGLVGASGGGKSVLMRTIIGLIPKRSGRIEVMGVDIDNSHRPRRSRRCDVGHPVPAGRTVFLSDRTAKYSVSTSRKPRPFRIAD